jgi:hypothetical protein
MRTIPEVFQANEIKQFAIPGGRIEILSCSAAGTVSVSLQDANGVEVTNGFAKDIEAGSYMQPPSGFQRFAITSSVAQTVKFLVSSGDSGTRSVAGTVAVAGTVSVVGTVNIIDGGKSRTLANGAFIAEISTGGSAGNAPALQLWNPVGSGKNVIISKFHVGTDTAGAAYCGWSNTLIGGLASPVSKLAGGAAPVAKKSTAAGALGGVLNRTHTVNLLSNDYKPIELREPIVLPPGYGFYLQHTQAAAVGLFASLEFIEE